MFAKAEAISRIRMHLAVSFAALGCLAVFVAGAARGSAIAIDATADRAPSINAAIGVRAFTVQGDLAEYEKWLGRPAAFVLGFASGDKWAKALQQAHQQDGIPVNKPIAWALALATKDTSLADTAAGKNDSAIRSIAAVMAKRPQNSIYVRVGWEQNLRNSWTAVGREKDYKLAFRHVALLLRSFDSRFRTEWCPGVPPFSPHHPRYDVQLTWPGDDVVDRVCADAYYRAARQLGGGSQAFLALHDGAFGLAWIADFARAHQKPLSIGEWGLNTDQPEFIERMATYIRENHVQSVGFWNRDVPGDPNYQDRLSSGQHPQAGQAYIQAFGKH